METKADARLATCTSPTAATAASDGDARWAEQEARRVANERSRWLDALERSAGPKYVACSIDGYDVADADEESAALKASVRDTVREYAETLPERAKAGENLVLAGAVGTGKDHLAVAVGLAAIRHHGLRAVYERGVDLAAKMRDAIGADRAEGSVLHTLQTAPLLILSDPIQAGADLSDFQRSTLLRVVEHRQAFRRPTVVTINVLNGDEGREAVGPATWDRLIDGAWLCRFEWASYRKAARVVGVSRRRAK